MWALYHGIADWPILGFALALSLLAGKRTSLGRSLEKRLALVVEKHPTRFCLAIAVTAFVGSAVVSLGWEFPQPSTHDEFSYLLAADTYAHGRLANPPHPLWKHFETFHVIQQPTYASRYPPGQGLVLAAGQVLGGHPIVGVWLSAALGCAALCWMLRAWLTPLWAVYGSFLVLLRLGIAGYWTQSYWGGWVAAAGAALLLGGLRRLAERPGLMDSLILALGLVVLANSRPFEGLMLAMPCAIVLFGSMVGHAREGRRGSIRLIVVPIALVLVLNGLWTARVNRAVTGDPLKFPHAQYIETYMSAPYFLFLSPGPKKPIRHREMARLHNDWERGLYERQMNWSGWLKEKKLMFKLSWRFFLGVALSLPLIFLLVSLRDRWVQFALGVLILYFGLNLVVMSPTLPHYPAPMVPLLYFLVIKGLSNAYDSERWHRTGAVLTRALPIVGLITLAYSLARPNNFATSPHPNWHRERARILDELEQAGGEHLIIVRYRRSHPTHYVHEEWVYNEADIDAASVVWAREMSTEKNRRLLRKMRKRQAWLLEADVDEPRLVPYPAPDTSV